MLLHMPFEITLDNYKEMLEKYFVYVGIVEDLQTSINVLSHKLAFPRKEYVRVYLLWGQGAVVRRK